MEEWKKNIISLNGKYLEIDNVANILGLSRMAIERRIDNGKILGVKKLKTLIPLDYVLGCLFEMEEKKK